MRELIYIVIESFYKKATTDILIGYHFAHFNDPGTLEPHLERITTFWEMQFTGQITKPLEGKGFQLMFTHLQLGIKKGELGRWVMLFHQTLAELEAEFEKQAPEELENIKKLNEEWKKRIDFFKTRFESHPQMFRQQ